jgi:hypothetical protein
MKEELYKECDEEKNMWLKEVSEMQKTNHLLLMRVKQLAEDIETFRLIVKKLKKEC